MATIAERLIKLGAKIAPWLPWIIANRPQWVTYQDAYSGHADFMNAVDLDEEIQNWPAGELAEALTMAFPRDNGDN